MKNGKLFIKTLKNFEEKEVIYGVGCSFNLFLRGIVDEFHDFDLIVEKESISTVKQSWKT